MVSRRYLFKTMKNPRIKKNPGLFLKVALSKSLLSSTFFAPISFFLLTADMSTKHYETLAGSLSEG